jgi:hypothetical protein
MEVSPRIRRTGDYLKTNADIVSRIKNRCASTISAGYRRSADRRGP